MVANMKSPRRLFDRRLFLSRTLLGGLGAATLALLGLPKKVVTFDHKFWTKQHLQLPDWVNGPYKVQASSSLEDSLPTIISEFRALRDYSGVMEDFSSDA